MTPVEATKIILTLISGICWTIVYVEGIRVGVRDRSYAIPYYALALNISWELIHAIYGFRSGTSLQAVINAVWFVLDVGILYTYFKFGRRYFARYQRSYGFAAWSVLGLGTAFCIEYAFVREFGVGKGAGYSAFLQNLLMSILFIQMLAQRGKAEGQSMSIAVSKWIGTLAPAIQFGLIGEQPFPNGSFLILTLGVLCSVFDLIYIRMLRVESS